jgi:hypothetical protein
LAVRERKIEVQNQNRILLEPMRMQQNQQTVQPSAPMPQGTSPWNNAMYAARNFFTYESDITATLNSATGTNLTFNIAGDSDFFWTKFSAFATVGGAATLRGQDQLPYVTMLLINTTTGRQYSNVAVPLPNMAGTGELPFILPQITMWQRKSTIQVQLQNVGNVNYSALNLSFMGIKAFPQPGQ